MELQNLEKEILALCADEETELWLIVKRISKGNYSFNNTPKSVRQQTIEVLRSLLENELIKAGYPNKVSFQVLPITGVGEIITYIEQEWDKLGKTPNIGDGCWFRATAKGEQLARELGLM